MIKNSHGSHQTKTREDEEEPAYDDEMASRMSRLLSCEESKNESILVKNLESSALGRAAIIQSIRWLSRHLPRYALNQIRQHVVNHMNGTASKESPMTLPFVSSYRAALLFVDMSGFTKLSQHLDVESLSKAINSYFQAIVDEVTAHGGDVLKFAGDAIYAEWRVQDNRKEGKQARRTSRNGSLKSVSSHTSGKRLPTPSRGSGYSSSSPPKSQQSSRSQIDNEFNMEGCVRAAAICGTEIVRKCADHPIYAKSVSDRKGPLLATLNVHCGVGAGEMAGVHVGNEYNRREYLILGEPIDQVSEACDSANLGEIRASAAAISYLNKGQTFKDQLQVEKGAKSVLIASRRQVFFKKSKKPAWSMNGRVRKSTKMKKKSSISFDQMDMVSLQYFRKVLSFYVHPVVVSDESSYMYKPTARGDSQMAQERHRAEAELRSVFTIFIQPKINATLTDDPATNATIFKKLNDIMNAVTSVLDSFKGHLRQYIVDDKGVVLIATFGLRGSTFPNMVADRALPTCRIINSVLHEELGIESQIGGTLGKVYCGVVGGLKRHEYAVLGPSVNLSARLMSQKNHPGVMVDDAVRKKSTGMNFISFPPVKAKGYDDLVPVFKPLTAQEAKWGKVNPKFVGRKEEMAQVCKLALDMSQCECPSKLLFVWGDSGSGKSSFIVHAIDKARKVLMTNMKRVVITRNISSEGDSLVPFSLFRSVFRDVLGEKPLDDEYLSNGSFEGRDWDTSSYNSGASSSLYTVKIPAIQRLQELCVQMDAPEGFLEIVAENLLGDTKGKLSKLRKAPELDDMIIFMANVFIQSTSHADSIILALDDVQWMDTLSWKVVQCILESSQHILIVCGSRPLNSQSLTIDEDFFSKLNGEHRASGISLDIDISWLRKDDIKEMAAIALLCEAADLDEGFCEDIYKHSGGMPYFASEILENCVRQKRCARFDNGKVGWGEGSAQNKHAFQFANIEELFLSRLDTFDDMTRKTLHIAAVLGMTFMFSEILEISEHILSISKDDKEVHALAIKKSLKTALDEGIFDANICENDNDSVSTTNESDLSEMIVDVGNNKESESPEVEVDESYAFYHDTWRRVIKSLMLDSWVKDIHMHAAMAIETRIPDNDMRDYSTKVKLFQHWKGSRNTIRSAIIALDIGKDFKDLGMNRHSIQIYEGAIDMWKNAESEEDEDLVAGFASQVLDSLDEENVVLLVKLQTALGQAIGSIYQGSLAASAQAFETALSILRYAPAASEIKDRAFIFPIYSGMFFLLKYGALCEPSEQVATELDLVHRFVKETEKHGDPVHYGRALAMQGETCHRLGKFEDAINSHLKLRDVYDVDKHSSLVVASYASDRCAQNYGCTANCYMRLGQVDKALEICDFIEHHLMPKMDPKNVHNSCVMIMPSLWIWNDNGMAEKSQKIFQRYVLEPFDKYFGKDGTTPFLASFKPIQIFFDILVSLSRKDKEIDESYFEWALDLSNMEIGSKLDSGIGNFGRSAMSVSAEICLHLSKNVTDSDKRIKLIENGVKLADLAMSGCDGQNGASKNLTAYIQIEPIHKELHQVKAGIE